MKIFVVDDEPMLASMLAETIKEALPNENPVEFNKPKAMLEKVKEECPDVVFLDIEMPGLDGITLAKSIREVSPDTNIVFVTGYSNYCYDAFKIYASGYIMKPATADDITEVMKNLRHKTSKSKIEVKTFGNFSISVDGKPIKFRLTRSLEMLAYLVDRGGSLITKKEIAAVVFEADDYSRSIQSDITRVARWLEEDLDDVGASQIFIRDNGAYSINKNEFSCDLYDYLDKKGVTYSGEYMEQYSWAEYRKESLFNIK